jgi:hypothetical protein
MVQARIELYGPSYGISRDTSLEPPSSLDDTELNSPCEIPQYPNGTDLLWMANYRRYPDDGDTDGPSYKLSGTFQQAAEEAHRIAVRKGLILQSLRRRY